MSFATTPRVIPGVQNVNFPSEKEICRMFGVRVNGKTLRAKNLGESKAEKRLTSNTLDTMKMPVGLPGSRERLDALRTQYAIAEANDDSPFAISTDGMAGRLADFAASQGWDFSE